MRVTYYGPYSKEVAEILKFEKANTYVGKGCSKIQAKQDAIKRMRTNPDLEFKLPSIIRYIEDTLPPKADFVEAPEDFLNVYCVVEND